MNFMKKRGATKGGGGGGGGWGGGGGVGVVTKSTPLFKYPESIE
jgi:hypothetical protein